MHDKVHASIGLPDDGHPVPLNSESTKTDVVIAVLNSIQPGDRRRWTAFLDTTTRVSLRSLLLLLARLDLTLAELVMSSQIYLQFISSIGQIDCRSQSGLKTIQNGFQIGLSSLDLKHLQGSSIKGHLSRSPLCSGMMQASRVLKCNCAPCMLWFNDLTMLNLILDIDFVVRSNITAVIYRNLSSGARRPHRGRYIATGVLVRPNRSSYDNDFWRPNRKFVETATAPTIAQLAGSTLLFYYDRAYKKSVFSQQNDKHDTSEPIETWFSGERTIDLAAHMYPGQIMAENESGQVVLLGPDASILEQHPTPPPATVDQFDVIRRFLFTSNSNTFDDSALPRGSERLRSRFNHTSNAAAR